MVTYDIDLLHRRILRILMAVDSCCREHGLRYYIWAGTMIGAVRHKGFIPWDDDIDIAMPRPDYEQLIAHCREWLPAPYEFVCAENDPAYPLPFGKVQDASTTLIERTHLHYLGGIYIDVFPIDGVPGHGSTRFSTGSTESAESNSHGSTRFFTESTESNSHGSTRFSTGSTESTESNSHGSTRFSTGSNESNSHGSTRFSTGSTVLNRIKPWQNIIKPRQNHIKPWQNHIKPWLHFAAYEYWKRVLYLIHRDPYKHGHGPSSWVPLLCRKVYTMQGVQRKIRKLLLKYDYEQSAQVADYDDGRHGVMPKEVLGTPTPYPFEGETVLGVEHYDTYLSHKYGDYMTIPDGDHQRQHNFHVLDFDTPYSKKQKDGKL